MTMTTDVRWLNPFIKSAVSVFASFGVEINRVGSLRVQDDDATTDPVTVIIPVTGDLVGAALYGMPTRTATQVAGTMMGDMQRARLDDEIVHSALGELGNMITGQTTVLLEEAGKRCNIAPPLIVLKSSTIVASSPFQRIIAPLGSELGPMNIQLSVHEGADRG